jgi:phosphotransferase system HPr-like phosphotransfer protein
MTKYTLKTEQEQREAKAKAILALKFATVKENSLLYWIMQGNKAETITE